MSGLGVVLGLLRPAAALPNSQPSESDVVHDHIRLRQHEIDPIVGIAVGILAGQVEHTRITEGGETVSGPSCGGEFDAGGDSTEMINVGGLTPVTSAARDAHCGADCAPGLLISATLVSGMRNYSPETHGKPRLL